MKKTAKKKQAKKAPTKAARAIDEALGTFTKLPAENREEKFKKLIEIKVELNDDGRQAVKEALEDSAQLQKFIKEPESWVEYGPLGGQDEDAIAREVLGMEVGLPEEPVMAQEGHSTTTEDAPAQAVPEPSSNAPQGAPDSFEKKMDESFKKMASNRKEIEETLNSIQANRKLGLMPPSITKQSALCIESLIDALNYLWGHARKSNLRAHDEAILRSRIKIGRSLLSSLKTMD